jgi:predicted NBD/HSP70 family sugar kinase
MSLVAFAMNGFLAVLLIAALAFGWRLERRLKALRDSHEGFAKAVAELDQAAARAEQGLADLRAATDEAADTLAVRIERAQALAAQLDERINAPAPKARPDRPDRVEREERLSPTRGEPKPAPQSERRLKAEDFERLLDREDRLPQAARPNLGAPSASHETPRSRARIDDDLFDGPGDSSRPGSNPRVPRR